MSASSSLRQRRHRRDDEENANNNNSSNEEDEMELFAKHYKQATANNSISQCRMVLFILIGIIILAFTFIILQYNPSQSLLLNKSIQRQNLKLITIYPHRVASQIHSLKSQTELLITESNKEAINAIRIGIAMSNNLHYHHNTNAKSTNNNGSRIRKRKKGVAGILLGISNYITTLRSSSSSNDSVEEEEGYISGEAVLVAYDEIMIRNYLVDFGGKCSSNNQSDGEDGDMNSNENTILKRYDEISTLMQTTTTDSDTNMYKDILWNHIIQLFTLCQFTNNDARGYIAFNTTTISKSSGGKDQVSIQERLEESRLNGVGMIVKESDNDDDSLDMMEDGDDSLYYASLFVIPHEESARNMAREMLHKRLEEDIPSLATSRQSSKSSLLLEIPDDHLQKIENETR